MGRGVYAPFTPATLRGRTHQVNDVVVNGQSRILPGPKARRE